MTTLLHRSRSLVAAVAITLLSSALAQAHDHAATTPAAEQATGEHSQAMMRMHLDHAADRLEIRASQLPAWETLAHAMLDLAEHHPAPSPSSQGDAATLTRALAEHATDHANKVVRVAEATAALADVLDSNQNRLLTQMTRGFLAHHQAMHHGMHAEMMGGKGMMGSKGKPGASAGAEGEPSKADDPHAGHR